jgi:hypothetical protein
MPSQIMIEDTSVPLLHLVIPEPCEIGRKGQ